MIRTAAAVLVLVALLQIRADMPGGRVIEAPRVDVVTIYAVAPGEPGGRAGALGCGDALIAVSRAVPPTTAVLRASVEALLAAPERGDGPPAWYNALHQSRVAIEDVAVSGGVATLRLKGRIVAASECDARRIGAQLVETVRRAGAPKGVNVFVNGRPLARELAAER